MAKQSDLGRKIATLDAEIARLQGIRAYLLEDAPEQSEKPKRTRKPRGLNPARMTAKEMEGI